MTEDETMTAKMDKSIAGIRREYRSSRLDESDLDPNPVAQFREWMDEAIRSEKIADPTAMAFATASARGIPSVRIMLLKAFDEKGFVFFTNYASRKGMELDENPHGAILFYWPPLDRQVRIEGSIAKVSRKVSEEYFRSRPRESRIGAWASGQSGMLKGREELEQRFSTFEQKFGDGEIPLPPTWGGYRLNPVRFEFWQGRENRLHDRFRYDESGDGWTISRLAP